MKFTAFGLPGIKRSRVIAGSAALTLMLTGIAYVQRLETNAPQQHYSAAMDTARSGQMKAHTLVPVYIPKKTARVTTWTPGTEATIGPLDPADPARMITHRDFWLVLESEMAERCNALMQSVRYWTPGVDV